MAKSIVPCKDCGNRELGCHSSCKLEYDEYNKKFNEDKLSRYELAYDARKWSKK